MSTVATWYRDLRRKWLLRRLLRTHIRFFRLEDKLERLYRQDAPSPISDSMKAEETTKPETGNTRGNISKVQVLGNATGTAQPRKRTKPAPKAKKRQPKGSTRRKAVGPGQYAAEKLEAERRGRRKSGRT